MSYAFFLVFFLFRYFLLFCILSLSVSFYFPLLFVLIYFIKKYGLLLCLIYIVAYFLIKIFFLVDDSDKEEKDISYDENYTADSEDVYQEDDYDLDFLCLFTYATKQFKYQEPLFAFFNFLYDLVFISFVNSRQCYRLIVLLYALK